MWRSDGPPEPGIRWGSWRSRVGRERRSRGLGVGKSDALALSLGLALGCSATAPGARGRRHRGRDAVAGGLLVPEPALWAGAAASEDQGDGPDDEGQHGGAQDGDEQHRVPGQDPVARRRMGVVVGHASVECTPRTAREPGCARSEARVARRGDTIRQGDTHRPSRGEVRPRPVRGQASPARPSVAPKQGPVAASSQPSGRGACRCARTALRACSP